MPRVVASAVRKRTTQTGGKNDGEMEDVGGFKAMHRLDSGLEDQFFDSGSSGMQLASVDMSAGKREAIMRRPAPNPNSIIATPPHSFESKSQIMQKHKKAVIIAEASEKSFYCFSMQSGFRLLCINIMTQPWFDRIVLLLIIANSITLAAEDPLIKQKCEDPNDPDPPPCENAILVQCEVIFNILFTIEMLIKMVGIGVYGKPSSYLADPWNKMDFFVVCVGWLPTLIEAVNPPQEGEESSGPNLTAIRTVRILKVLKTIQRVEGVRRLVAALLSSLPLLMNVGNLLGFMFFVFGIFGLQLFMGKLRYKCFEKPEGIDWAANPDTEWLRVDEDDWAICGTVSGAWSQCDAGQICSPKVISGEDGSVEGLWNEDPGEGNIGFDNIFQAFLTILTAMSLEGWIDMCFAAWDAVGFIALPYFILIVVFGSLFAINLVVAVIYEAYVANAKDLMKPPTDMPQEIIEIEAAERAAEEEKKKIKARKLAQLEFPDRWRVDQEVVFPNTIFLYRWYAEFRDASYVLGTDENFGTIVTLAILVNTLFMSMEFHGASESHRQMLEEANWFFTILFTFELVVKSIGMGICNYLADPYNSFDASVVTFSWVEVALLSGGGFSSLRTFRLLRVLRTLKLAKSWHSLNQLIITVIRSIPGLANFGLILMLFLFIYALFGMQFYGGQFNEENGFDETPRANFNTLGFALACVFQVVTGENWNDVLYNVMKVNGVVGAVYASSMFCIGNYIVLNLFLAILLDNFQQAGGESKTNFYEEVERENDVKAALIKVRILLKNIYSMAMPSCFIFKMCELTEDEEERMSKAAAAKSKIKAEQKALRDAARAALPESERANLGDDSGAGAGGSKSKPPKKKKMMKRVTSTKEEADGYFFGSSGGGGGGGGEYEEEDDSGGNGYTSGYQPTLSAEAEKRKKESEEAAEHGYYFGASHDLHQFPEEEPPPPKPTFFKRMSIALGIQTPQPPSPKHQ
ncbi:hypothetical protein TrST_g6815 [Triparma strigata]|uniref:Ion transport domain-containing protein n=1 Tax=Triparma strigata TaxID=1606541 RepID=A0A9W7APX2_9STRA|nr:hypothetical protein TrST_g6815 [Triparma strigata]